MAGDCYWKAELGQVKHGTRWSGHSLSGGGHASVVVEHDGPLFVQQEHKLSQVHADAS
jgi:hypothetical protein